jgi:hypothetical protein
MRSPSRRSFDPRRHTNGLPGAIALTSSLRDRHCALKFLGLDEAMILQATLTVVLTSVLASPLLAGLFTGRW